MGRRLTVKQTMFANFLVGAAHGNGTVAARMAGYRGDARQLAVQASVNMKNKRIQELISKKLELLVEPSLSVLEDGLNATKQRAFMAKDGEILYGEPEPDHRVRVATAARILDHYERSSGADTGSLDDGVGRGDTEIVELPALTARGGDGEVHDRDGTHVDQFDPDDRVLLQQVEEIDAKLAALDREPDGADGGH